MSPWAVSWNVGSHGWVRRWTWSRSRRPAWAWRCARWSRPDAPAAPGSAAPRPPWAPCCSTSRSGSAPRPDRTCLDQTGHCCVLSNALAFYEIPRHAINFSEGVQILLLIWTPQLPNRHLLKGEKGLTRSRNIFFILFFCLVLLFFYDAKVLNYEIEWKGKNRRFQSVIVEVHDESRTHAVGYLFLVFFWVVI